MRQLQVPVREGLQGRRRHALAPPPGRAAREHGAHVQLRERGLRGDQVELERELRQAAGRAAVRHGLEEVEELGQERH